MIRYLFLSFFVGLLVISTVQFFMLEIDEMSNVTLVEEQQETFSTSIEMQALDFDGSHFQYFTVFSEETFLQKYSIIHIHRDYPQIQLAVPYSPPESC